MLQVLPDAHVLGPALVLVTALARVQRLSVVEDAKLVGFGIRWLSVPLGRAGQIVLGLFDVP